MPERPIQTLSFASSILLVEITSDNTAGTRLDPRYECRKCLVLDSLGTKTAAFCDRKAALEHLDHHAGRGEMGGGNGAKDAIWKLEQCDACRGAGRVRDGLNWKACEPCGQTGKNEVGRARGKENGVRRGVVVS